MQLTSISNIYASLQTNSTTSTSSTSSVDFSELLSSSSSSSSSSTSSSYDSIEISSAGAASMSAQRPPDFQNMSTDDFRSHLEDVYNTTVADGVSTEGFPDYANMSDAELDELKNEMIAQGGQGAQGPQGGGKAGGPPPPPPAEEEVTASSYYDSLLEALEEMEEAEEEMISSYLDDSIINSAAYLQLASQYALNQ